MELALLDDVPAAADLVAEIPRQDGPARVGRVGRDRLADVQVVLGGEDLLAEVVAPPALVPAVDEDVDLLVAVGTAPAPDLLRVLEVTGGSTAQPRVLEGRRDGATT